MPEPRFQIELLPREMSVAHVALMDYGRKVYEDYPEQTEWCEAVIEKLWRASGPESRSKPSVNTSPCDPSSDSGILLGNG